MIHPALATMLAVVTTDYPLEPGEAIASCGPRSSASFNRISVDGECSTNDAVVLLANGASGSQRRATTRLRGRAPRRLREPRRQIVADGEGATVLARDRRHRRRRRRRGEGDRAADRDLAARQDGGVRPRPELGPRARRRRLGAVQRRLRAARPDRVTLAFDGMAVLRARRAARRRAALAGAGCRSTSTSGSARGARRVPRRPTSRTTTSASTRSTRRDRVVVKLGGAVAAEAAARARRLAAEGHEVVRRPRRRPADLGGDGAARDSRSRSSTAGA